MKKKYIIISVFAVLCVLITFLGISVLQYSITYIYRVIANQESTVEDYTFFPKVEIKKSDTTYKYKRNIDNEIGNMDIEYQDSDGENKKALKEVLEMSDTTSFLIIKDDEIIYDYYGENHDESSIVTSFSMVKSVDSLLIGCAIEDGYITSVEDPISNYINEFEGKEIGEITIEELLEMRSTIAYSEGSFLWYGDDTLTYYFDDLRTLALGNTTLNKDISGFHYNNYHPLLLGIILERSTGVSVSQYLETKIWQPIGSEYDASWSIDSKETSFEKMESGLNFRAVDFAKVGSLILHDGNWNEQQIISSDWIKQSCYPQQAYNEQEYLNTFLEGTDISYNYMWYSIQNSYGEMDVFAWGKYGQFLYISPSQNIVIVRTGVTDNPIVNWPNVLMEISELN
ncbi:serine hydrolase domain-containing protein [Breznakia pachnodae]|uniref:CubicO group peptidase (Beta-lactamase class C family) n=1 Tax=Breznakia pachnodae TaxID=265178 RepID=A0ABU0E2I2_9FIRM|nr:serine hydrolase [Breznakia pachnodae]MDQ0361102.1 CubicO group peptidase (beta-lactamase class C family) [Breznakia pachnodae]